MIVQNRVHSDDKQSCLELLRDKAKKEWQLGKTKVQHTHTDSYTCPDMLLSLWRTLHSLTVDTYPGYFQQAKPQLSM